MRLRNFNELRAKMSPEARARSDAWALEELKDLRLDEIAEERMSCEGDPLPAIDPYDSVTPPAHPEEESAGSGTSTQKSR